MGQAAYVKFVVLDLIYLRTQKKGKARDQGQRRLENESKEREQKELK